MGLEPTQSNVQAALRSFLLAALPGKKVVAGVVNRVPELRDSDFVVIIPLRFKRLETNTDSAADVRFTGSIAGTVLTVTDVDYGIILDGATVFGTGITAGTVVVTQTSGTTGGIGTYTVSESQTVGSRTLASGAQTLMQPAEVTVQMDFHSAGTAGSDMAQTVSTLLRDPYGVEQFANQTPNYGVVPLHADDPKYMPFINEAQQYEWRWVVEACLQVNQTVSIPQQYADVVEVDLVSVDAAYPA